MKCVLSWLVADGGANRISLESARPAAQALPMERGWLRFFIVTLMLVLVPVALLSPALAAAQTEEGVTTAPQLVAVDRSEWNAAIARYRIMHDAGEKISKTTTAMEVLGVARRLFGPESREALAFEHVLGGLYLADNRFDDAVPLLEHALNYARPWLGHDSFDTWNIVAALANAYRGLGRHADADPLFERAIADSEILMNPEHPDVLMAVNALVKNRLGDPQLATTALPPARRLLTEVRRRRGTMANPGLVFSQRIGDLGNRSVEVCQDLGVAKLRERRDSDNDLGAFSLMADAAWFAADQPGVDRTALENEAFMALQDLVSRPAGKAVERMAMRRLADRRAPGAGELVRQRQTLDDLLVANADVRASRTCDYGDGPQTAEKWIERLKEGMRLEQIGDQLTAARDQLDEDIRRAFPDYFTRQANPPLSIAEAQALLPNDEAIFLISETASGLQSMAISRNATAWSRSSWTTEQMTEAVKRLLWDVGADVEVDAATTARWLDQGSAGYPFDRKTAFAVYGQMIAPLAAVLKGKTQVFVAAGGMFSGLPLGILVTRPPQGQDGNPDDLRRTAWFVDDHALTIIPSLASWQFLREARQPLSGNDDATGRDFVGYGDPALKGTARERGARSGLRGPDQRIFRSAQGASGGGITDLGAISRLPRLPGTAQELEAMRSTLGASSASVHLRDDATETAVRSDDLSAVRILAFATHGLLAGELSGNAEPGLIFTPPAVASDGDDGFLSASEIAGMTLDADWVILSACNTAGGDGSGGAPGLSGLARAFFYAGAHSLLVSHWPVRDDVAAQITVDAIRRRQENPQLSRAAALQAAMQAIRSNRSHDSPTDSWAHPEAWAAFSLIGGDAR